MTTIRDHVVAMGIDPSELRGNDEYIEVVHSLVVGPPGTTVKDQADLINPANNLQPGDVIQIRRRIGALADPVTEVFPDVILADEPDHYLRFGESSGTVAANIAGAGDGTYVNAPTLGVDGLVPDDAAVTCAAASAQEITMPNPGLSVDAAIEFWFAWTAGVALMRDHTNAGGWIMGYDNGGTFAVRVAGTTIVTSKATAAVRDGHPHHLVVNKDGPVAEVFLDDELIGVTSSAADNPTSGIWHIARNGTSASPYATATFDEFAIYPAKLPRERITAHFTAGKA